MAMEAVAEDGGGRPETPGSDPPTPYSNFGREQQQPHAEAAKINLGATVRMVATRAADRAALRVPIAALRDVAGVPRGIGAIAGVGRRPLVFRERPVDGVPRDGLDHRPMTTSAGREEAEDTDHHHAVVFQGRTRS